MTELLAPVPLVHLESMETAGRSTGVFGTRSIETFQRLDRDGGPGTTVLLYASHIETPFEPVTTWRATYDSWKESVGNGLVPKVWRHERPPTTYEEDRVAGYFFAYYRVTDLRRLDREEQVGFGALRSDTTGKKFADEFVPEGPILVYRATNR